MVVLGIGDQGLVDKGDLFLQERQVRVEVGEESQTVMPDLIRFEVLRGELVHQGEFCEEVCLKVEEGGEAVLPTG